MRARPTLLFTLGLTTFVLAIPTPRDQDFSPSDLQSSPKVISFDGSSVTNDVATTLAKRGENSANNRLSLPIRVKKHPPTDTDPEKLDITHRREHDDGTKEYWTNKDAYHIVHKNGDHWKQNNYITDQTQDGHHYRVVSGSNHPKWKAEQGNIYKTPPESEDTQPSAYDSEGEIASRPRVRQRGNRRMAPDDDEEEEASGSDNGHQSLQRSGTGSSHYSSSSYADSQASDASDHETPPANNRLLRSQGEAPRNPIYADEPKSVDEKGKELPMEYNKKLPKGWTYN